jgi:tripartite-type tricarboxylate transporter receptor subunit TctC
MIRIGDWRLLAAAVSMVVLSAGTALAAFPDRTVQIYVGYAPGGNSDFSARLVAKKLSEKWGQPVVVVNRPGADSTISSDFVAHSAPDGYTLAWISNSHTITPNQYKLGYDPLKSFEPISEVASAADVLVINSTLPVNSLKELIAYAKAKPGQLNFGSNGTGGLQYLEAVLLAQRAGIDMVGIPYKGGSQLLVALLGNEIQMAFGSVLGTKSQVEAGKFKALAVSTAKRSPMLPEVPTVAEAAGLDGYDETEWYGIVAPAGTPADIVKKIHDDLVEVLHAPDVQATLAKQGYTAVGSSSEAFRKQLADEVDQWSAFLKTIKLPNSQ